MPLESLTRTTEFYDRGPVGVSRSLKSVLVGFLAGTAPLWCGTRGREGVSGVLEGHQSDLGDIAACRPRRAGALPVPRQWPNYRLTDPFEVKSQVQITIAVPSD